MRGWRAPVTALALAALCLFSAPAPAGSRPRLLAAVDVTSQRELQTVIVRLSCPVSVLDVFPPDRGAAVEVQFEILPGCPLVDPSDLQHELIEPRRAARDLIDTVVLEPGFSGTPTVVIRFMREVRYSVEPANGVRELRIQVPRAKAVVETPVIRPVRPQPVTAVERRGLRGAVPQEQSAQELGEARNALLGGDLATAIRMFTKVLEYPENPSSPEAQELLGVARERSRQLAHAKAEYEDYLRRYPQGEATDRVRQRLAAIVTADQDPRSLGPGGQRKPRSNWDVYGGLSQYYRRDTLNIQNRDQDVSLNTQSSLLNDADITLRRRGTRFDFMSRASAGYLYDALPGDSGRGNETRVSTAFVELSDRKSQLAGRVGRQSRNSGGILGTFDGFHLGWQTNDWLKLNATYGFPVENSRQNPETGRHFVSLAADFGTFANAWDFTLFAVQQDYEGVLDRRAIGGELRYFRDGRSIYGLLDYDLKYRALNNAFVLATVPFGLQTLTVTLDRRKAPTLTTRNALIGQPVEDFATLTTLFDAATLRQLADDRTADSSTIALYWSRPVGEHWQMNVDASHSRLSSTPASGGVEGTPSTSDSGLGVQMIGTSLWKPGDVWIVGVRGLHGDGSDTASAFLSTRFPFGRGLRIGPRLRFDYRTFDDDTSQWLASPSLRVDWVGRRFAVELEGGSEWSSRSLLQDREKTRRWFVSMGYRWQF